MNVSASGSLVGRAAERRQIDRAIDAADVGAVVVEGVSGAGKTALVESVLPARLAEGALVGAGRYPEGDASQGLRPMLAALGGAAERALESLYDPVAGAQTLSDLLGPRMTLLAA